VVIAFPLNHHGGSLGGKSLGTGNIFLLTIVVSTYILKKDEENNPMPQRAAAQSQS
jgi:hypothetical protein